MSHAKFKNNIVASIKSYRQTDIKRTAGIQSRVITIPGAVIDFVEKIFHPEPGSNTTDFKLKECRVFRSHCEKPGAGS